MVVSKLDRKILKKDRIKGDSWVKQDYKDFVLNLLRKRGDNSAYLKVKISENFEYYYGTQENKSYKNLLTLHEGSGRFKGSTPFVKINFDDVSQKVNLLLGELEARGFEINVNAVNNEAIRRKKQYENQLRYLMMVQPMLQNAAQFTGVEYGLNNNLPKNMEEFKEHMDNYRDIFEICMETAVQDNVLKYKYEYLRKNLFLDLLVGNWVHCKNEIRNGFTQWRRVNPLNALFDESFEDDFASDMADFSEVYYMNIPDAIEKFDIPKDEMKKMISEYRKGGYGGYKGTSVMSPGNSSILLFSPFEKRHGNSEYYYDRVLIVESEWLDVETITQKVTHDPHGKMHVHDYEGYHNSAKLTGKEKKDPRSSLKRKNIQIVRKATLIGGDIVVNYGKTGNYQRDFSNPETTRLNYVTATHNYNNQETTSFIDRIKYLQEFKNYILTVMQKEVTTHIGEVVHIDKSRVDTETYGKGKDAIKNVLSGLKNWKVAVGNGAKNQFGGRENSSPFDRLPVTSQTFTMECLRIAMFLEEQIQKVAGINESRVGVGGDRELASVNNQRLSQSNYMTNSYFSTFAGFETRLFEMHIKQLAMAWDANPELYENIAARLGLELPEDFKMDIQSYTCYVSTYPLSRRELRVAAEGSLSQGNLGFVDYLEIMTIANQRGGLSIAMREFIKGQRKREAEAAQAEQRRLEIEMQDKERDRQFQLEKEGRKATVKGEYDLKKERMKQDGSRLNTKMTNATQEAVQEKKLEEVFAKNRLQEQNEQSQTRQPI